ncbi:IS1 transposase [Legionella massiliensis]|uniref:IS1 transposase n=1 Tax=Legionella massiliensis TaxID=1034943 RepID=A0A078KUE8_9GAMM|nr:IS1 family transposase [Legionella massiliensis]CDZ76661.1 IS1 transposase [Legionella massiliensis]CEE12399.1 IS1 transposase [Legionella massiliensis]
MNWEKLLATNTELKQQPILLLPVALELDEQWSFVRDKSNQRWLWLALNHYSSEILAYTFGDRTDKTCKQLQHLLEPFNITQYFTDGLGAHRLLPFEQHEEGKRNTQKIERKILTFRTRIKRLARKTICFSKSELMHDTAIGLFINLFEFARNV